MSNRYVEDYSPKPCVIIPADPKLPMRFVAEQSTELKEMQKLVGGYIEVVRIHRDLLRELEHGMGDIKLGRKAVLVVHEEGRLLNLPYNARASMLYADPMGICGDAFVMEVP